ncbi:hypothetical protein JL720_15941 [Aureococcus anophagefferens]|nr:hypothetical protein JL720_15941 [Aureococcus anophagefferens]
MAKAVEDMDGNGNGEITREAFVKWYSTCEAQAWFATSEFFQAKSSQTKAVVEAAGDEEDGEGLSLSWPADASPSRKFFFAAPARPHPRFLPNAFGGDC